MMKQHPRSERSRGPYLAFALVACALSAASCDGAESSTATTTTDASGCATDPRVQEYTVGLEASSDDGSIVVKFLDVDPSPPTKGDNIWKIQILDGAGAPVNDAVINVQAFMPDHSHSSTVVPEVTPLGTDGSYELDPVNLFMPGVWEVTLDIAPPGGTVESVLVTFCVEG